MSDKEMVQRVVARTLKADRGGISFGLAEQEAKKMLRKVRPAGNRRKTLEAIADATGANDILMKWFSEGGRINYETVGDIFGEPLWRWKEDWELEDNDDYEELSRDATLAKLIARKVEEWKARGGAVGEMPRDYSQAERILSGYRGLSDLVRGLAAGESRDEDGDRKECIKKLKQLHGILK